MSENQSQVDGIDWNDFLGANDLAEHAETVSTRVDPPNLDVSPPVRRLLISRTKVLDDTDQINFRLAPECARAVLTLERMAQDEFEEGVNKSYVRDAIVRVAAAHPDEVIGMLAAYGFDFTCD